MNLERALASENAQFAPVHIDYREPGVLRAPWAVRGSIEAWHLLRQAPPADATFFHTQTVSLLARQASCGRPYVVSVDATPAQMDELGAWYSHRKGSVAAEALKKRWYRHVFSAAAGIVAWSQWAADSLVADYGVRPADVRVVAPGASPGFFNLETRPQGSSPVRILFVGGDFERKGGPLLLRAFERLRGIVELVLVTSARVPERAGVRVVGDATPGSAKLMAAYEGAQIFCLPTLADCTSVAIQEAMAAGLPVLTTRVGSNAETVRDGVSGVLVRPGDENGLTAALQCLVDDASVRAAMGRAARQDARERLDAAANARRIGQLLVSVA